MNDHTRQYRELAFATSRIQDIKLRIHALYSDKPIDLNASVAHVANLKGGESVVDIGCGTGTFLRYLRQERFHGGALYGLDFTSGVFAPTYRESLDRQMRINFAVCNAEQLCLPSQAMDVVLMQHMLGFVPDMDAACRESRRVMRRGGVCVVTANAMRNYPHVLKYRASASRLLGWPAIEVNTQRFCAENMQEILGRTFKRVKFVLLEGHLRIPADEFIVWFTAMFDNWHPLPTEHQRALVLEHLVDEWIAQDIDAEGFINEPKWAGIALCTHD